MSFLNKIIPVIFLLLSSVAYAAPELLPAPKVVTGVLDNGLTYHLYESNDEKKDDHDEEISLRLYVKIGSLDENDQQKGYAHLVEHLGFRDSRYFTYKEKDEFLENLGLHTNAYTTYNRTVYYVNDRHITEERMEKHLKLFRDFADGMIIKESDFELERKIVLEELRLRASKEGGIDDKLTKVYDNGQYLDDKKPIGTKEVLNAATAKSVKEFMDTWYQPQHMHFIVTGQIDAELLEKQIIQAFSDMEADEAVKQPEPVYTLPTDIHFVTADDSTGNNVSLIIPLPDFDAGVQNADDYQKEINYFTMSGGIDSHLQRKNDANGKALPYISAAVGFYEHRSYLEIYMEHQDDKRNEALEFALNELALLREYGFTPSQFKNQLDFKQRQVDDPYSPFKKDGRPGKIADEIIANINQVYINVSEKSEAEQVSAYLETAEIESVNQLLQLSLQNKSALIVISREVVADDKQAIASNLVKAYNDHTMAIPEQDLTELADKKLPELNVAPGKITAEKTIDTSDIVQLTLSNGANAYLLKRVKDEGHVNVAAYSRGGSQSLPLELQTAAIFARNVLAASGLGGLEQYELVEFLDKKRITRLNSFRGSVTHGYSASVEKPEGLEDMFKLIHMGFYQGKVHSNQFKDNQKSTSDAYAKWYTTEEGMYHIQTMTSLFEKGVGYYVALPENIDTVTEDDIKKVYNHFYGDMSNYHFVIAGDFDEVEIRGLLEKYIANIPSNPVVNQVADIVAHKKDLIIRAINNPKDQSAVRLTFHTSKYEKSFENNAAQVIAARILTKRIYDIMRKEEGLTYGVRVGFSPQEGSVENSRLVINFSVKPSNEKRAIAIVDEALNGLIDNPITEEEFIDKRDKMLEDHEKVRNSNASNVGYIGHKFALGYDLERIANLIPIIKATKYELVRDTMPEFIANSYRVSRVFSNVEAPQ